MSRQGSDPLCPPHSKQFLWRYVSDAACFVYTCRRLIDLSLLRIYMPALDRSLCWRQVRDRFGVLKGGISNALDKHESFPDLPDQVIRNLVVRFYAVLCSFYALFVLFCTVFVLILCSFCALLCCFVLFCAILCSLCAVLYCFCTVFVLFLCCFVLLCLC